jgi:hypothetical protein
MTEPIVLGTRKNIIGETELLDPSQTLKKRRIDNLLLPLRDGNETIENIVDHSSFQVGTPPSIFYLIFNAGASCISGGLQDTHNPWTLLKP